MTGGGRTRRFIIPGGGCFGTHYARSLARAIERGRLASSEVWNVDRDPGCAAATLESRAGRRLVISDWDDFFQDHLADWQDAGEPVTEDLLVPVHSTPHLFARWLTRALAGKYTVEGVEVSALPTTPFAGRVRDRGITVSFAEWLCPTHCVEPYLCPATRQQRNWDIGRALVTYARELRDGELPDLEGPLLARCTHLVEGVGVVVLWDWVRAARRIAARARTRNCHALIGTVSGCHGIAQILSVRPRRDSV
jgi:hypothetical protein